MTLEAAWMQGGARIPAGREEDGRHGVPGLFQDFFKFFRDLAKNNDREWFEANKARYREIVQAPMSDFIAALAPKLQKISPHFRADPRPNGGSMFRIHRDVRFSKDKSPYKTHASAHFRHERAKDAHAPGYYLHLAPKEVLFGGGVWMPDPPALAKIRSAIAEESKAWAKAKSAKSVLSTFGGLSDHGDSLSRPPKGFAPDHPMIEDLKRKSFFVMHDSSETDAASPKFVDAVAAAYKDAAPVMRFLCEAVDAEF
ncbi:MAG: DUF2461 domain-containing protein [Hyphomonadaceae bacterium]